VPVGVAALCVGAGSGCGLGAHPVASSTAAVSERAARMLRRARACAGAAVVARSAEDAIG